MESKNNLKLYIKFLLSYLKDRKNIILFFAGVQIIYAVIYMLFHYKSGTYLYALLVVCTFAFIIGICDFVKYIEKHKKLIELLRNIECNPDMNIKSENLIEKDLVRIITKLFSYAAQNNFSINNSCENMSNYYSMWVHQIKTPISAASLIIQASDNFPEKNMLKQELFKINEYAEMALQYAKLEYITSDLKLKKYSLERIVKDVVKKYSSVFIYKKIGIKIEEINKEVITDDKLVSFVIQQVISNAIKYTKKGRITIYMDSENENTLVIKDTGMGISKEDIPRIFERGFTGYNGHEDKKASGIGLYLCSEVIKKLGHKIYIKSEQGKGTEVYIDFTSENIKFE